MSKINSLLFVRAIHSIGGVTTWSFQVSNFLKNTNVIAVTNQSDILNDQHLFPSQPKILKTQNTIEESFLDNETIELIKSTDIFFPNYVRAGYDLFSIAKKHNKNAKCIGICHTDNDYYYDLLVAHKDLTNKFIAVSNRTYSKLCNLIPNRINDIHRIPYGVKYFPFQPKTRLNNTLKLLYCGRISEKQKRVSDLVKLCTELNRLEVKYTIDIIGVGPDLTQLKALFLEKDIKNAEFKNAVPQKDLLDIYKNYDCLIMTSENEGASITMLEAMMQGVIPFVTNVSGAEDIINNGINGFLCDIGDTKKMALDLLYLYKNQNLIESISYDCHQSVKEKYNQCIQLEKLNALIVDVFNTKEITIK